MSVYYVSQTLNEMKIQRNNAYRPDIVFESTDFSISWGDPKNLKELDNPFIDSCTIPNPTSLKMQSRNIGVGVAKKVIYSVNVNTYVELLNLLQQLDPSIEYKYQEKVNTILVNIQNNWIEFPAKHRLEKIFLLPNAEEIHEFYLCYDYLRLFLELHKTQNWSPSIEIPDFKIDVYFSDIQGNHYKKEILLKVVRRFLVLDVHNSGSATYEIFMK